MLKEKFDHKLQLQLFAEPPADPPVDPKADPPADPPADPKPKDPPADPPAPKYTDDDVNKILDQKFAEWQKKQEQKVAEAEKLAKMNADQKAAYERKQLESKVVALEKKESLALMSRTARGMLTDKNITVGDELLSHLVSEDADDTKKAVDSFVELFQAAVQSAVKDALKGEPPKTGSKTGMTKEEIMKVGNRTERQRLIKENIELFNE